MHVDSSSVARARGVRECQSSCASLAPKRESAVRSLCLRAGRRVPFSAVNPLCTSFPFNLRRIARSRAARALVCVLALALSAANVLMIAMPSAAMAADHGNAHGAAASHQAGHAHCAEDSSTMGAHAGHGADGACCIGKTCTCVHACGDVPVLALLSAVPVPSTRLLHALPSRVYTTLVAPLLRPPIA